MKVSLPADLRAAIAAHAAQTYPEECCGLLAGRVGADGDVVVDEVRRSANVSDGDRTHGFEVDPQVRFDLMRACEKADAGRAIVGHYHSHPDHPAEPSATDLARAHEPDLIWLICGGGKDGWRVRAFKARADRSAFDELTFS